MTRGFGKGPLRSTVEHEIAALTQAMRKQFEATPAIVYNGRVCTSDRAKANAFVDYLAAVHRKHPNTREFQAHITRNTPDFVERIPLDSRTYASLRTSPGEMKRYLQGLNSRRAPGPFCN